jgi:hypothetical protein
MRGKNTQYQRSDRMVAPRAGFEPATNRLTAPYDGVFCSNLPVHDPGKTFVPSEKGAM